MVLVEANRCDPTFRRPWTMLAAILTAAHHGFELSSGIGLVGQPELGLVGSSALWGAQIPTWIAVAAKGGKRWDRLLAIWSGAALGGAAVHFLIWPWRQNTLGLPVLTEAEGLGTSKLPAYNALLYGWGAAAALSIALEVPPRKRRWALLGIAALPLLRRSAEHHFSWIVDQAATRPAWWNRGVQADRNASELPLAWQVPAPLASPTTFGIGSDTIGDVDVGLIIRTAREQSKLSLRALAARAGTSHATLSAYENGRVDPTTTVLARIIRATGYSLESTLLALPSDVGGMSRGEELIAVLELAEQFPARHASELGFPLFKPT